jgi:hypothetical protein
LGDFCSGSAAASVLFRSGVAITVTDGSKIVARVVSQIEDRSLTDDVTRQMPVQRSSSYLLDGVLK